MPFGQQDLRLIIPDAPLFAEGQHAMACRLWVCLSDRVAWGFRQPRLSPPAPVGTVRLGVRQAGPDGVDLILQDW
jgi:hypothetical protein